MGRRTTRWNVDVKLYTRLLVELDLLSMNHRTYVIRLHDLGDFPSTEYVGFWFDALEAYPGLRLYGYTHWDRGSEIGSMIEVESSKWDRFRIRFSDNHTGRRTTHVIGHHFKAKRHRLGEVCQADDEHPDITCGSCARCFTSQVPIAFKAH